MKILNIKDIYYSLDNTDILKGISIDIKEGDCISLVGQSGSGKSTLMKLCADLIPISKGNITYRGKDYMSYNPVQLRQKISYCIQIPQLFGKTVYDNLEFPSKIRSEKINKNKIIYLLERFNLDESYLTKDINFLSGGEKQRIAIIRNLIYTPDILLLDESTASLDRENERVIEDYVKELNLNGVTVLWITHSKEQSEGIFNKRITISEGKIDKVEEFNK
jgi:putative ABC transport system ATP-binding protein